MSLELLKKGVEEIRPSGFLDYRLFLNSLYSYIKRSSGQYSYQKFAGDIGFNESTVIHQIIKGYRPLTVKAAKKIAKALDLPKIEESYFLKLVEYVNAKTTAKRQDIFEDLLTIKNQSLPDPFDQDVLLYFSEWYHPVIRELVGASDFKNDVEWIGKRIVPNLTIEHVKNSLELLTRLDLIAYDNEQKTYVQTKTRVSTGHKVEGMALVSYHQKMIEHALEALRQEEARRRDISALTVTVSEDTAQKIKSMIHTFQLQLLDEAEKAGTGNQVYQINIQLFPFTK